MVENSLEVDGEPKMCRSTRKLKMDLYIYSCSTRAPSLPIMHTNPLQIFELNNLHIIARHLFPSSHCYAELSKTSVVFWIYDLKCISKAKVIFYLGNPFKTCIESSSFCISRDSVWIHFCQCLTIFLQAKHVSSLRICRNLWLVALSRKTSVSSHHTCSKYICASLRRHISPRLSANSGSVAEATNQ